MRLLMLMAIALKIAPSALAHTPPPSFPSEIDLLRWGEAAEDLPNIPASTFDEISGMRGPNAAVAEELERRTNVLLFTYDDDRDHRRFAPGSTELASWSFASGDENNFKDERELSLELHRDTEFKAAPFVEPATGLRDACRSAGTTGSEINFGASSRIGDSVDLGLIDRVSSWTYDGRGRLKTTCLLQREDQVGSVSSITDQHRPTSARRAI